MFVKPKNDDKHEDDDDKDEDDMMMTTATIMIICLRNDFIWKIIDISDIIHINWPKLCLKLT